MAFGNGAPDIFSSIIGITNANPNLVIGQLYGAGIFVTTVVVGSILLQKPFEIMKRPLLRDISFYIITTTLVWTTFLTRKILLSHSIIFIITYLIYVIVVIVSGYIYKRRQRSLMEAAHTNHAIEYHGVKMPRENLHRQTKYVVNKSSTTTTTTITESTTPMDKKNVVDGDEGVVLRRMSYVVKRDPTQSQEIFRLKFVKISIFNFSIFLNRYQTSTILPGSNTTKTFNIISHLFGSIYIRTFTEAFE